MKIKPLFVIFSFLLLGQIAKSQIKLVIPNLQSSQGSLFVAVYNSASHFLDQEKAIVKEVIPIQQDSVVFELKGLAEGTYSIALFQDEDNSNSMNTFFGYPLEPYGFSQNKSGSRLGPPSFEETSFYYSGQRQRVEVSLIH